MARAYYNEIDPYAAQWLRNLITAGEIAPGDVDTRSISDVQPSDLDGYTQCHFFAGVGIWSRALRTAGWHDAQPIWTGSCPCQPFSAAGASAGFSDERHLWPHWHWLIEQCRPETVFGEQVASADGLVWADLVSADMEATDYALGFVDTCAAGFRSFHIRQRLYFAAYDCRPATAQSWQDIAREHDADVGRLGFTKRARLEGHQPTAGQEGRETPCRSGVAAGLSCGLADARFNLPDSNRPEKRTQSTHPPEGKTQERQRRRYDDECSGDDVRADPPHGYWQNADWLFCRDGVWRPVRPGSFPLAHAATARMGRLRAYGNGLDLAQATGFIRAYMDRHMADLDATPAGDLFEWGTP
ncbi:DNA cytosine methyltransferase [Shimia thalassica]|uniref:DNA cytosine methyltransferase n=1 Tax=Shimia thalassica TaxID=1715693 RepID=UPI002733A2F6|nr:DNA cytosine methyltransferase [Shimia thalassica]MDP2495888.1 DNA cytosine methyltransferase [Shimia thalassica]